MKINLAVFLVFVIMLSGCATGGGKKIRYLEINSRDCYVCQRMEPIINAIESEFSDSVDISTYSGSSDNGMDLVKKYNIKKYPANIFLDDKGTVFFRYEGLMDIMAIKGVFKTKGVIAPVSVTQSTAVYATPPAAAK